jgi:hypothetical protein
MERIVMPKRNVSRRSVLRGAAGAGAAGLAGAALGTTALAAPAAAAANTETATGTRQTDANRTPIVVHVRDAHSGDIEVFAGTSQTSLRDRDLAARIARAIS